MQTMMTRRGFFGSAAGTAGLAAMFGTLPLLGAMANGQTDAAPMRPAGGGRPKGIRVGMLTAPFGDRPLVEVLEFARKAGISCL